MKDVHVDRDIGLFIDWWVIPAAERVIAKNKIDGEFRQFQDLTSAIDWVSTRTNTLSPRYPAGYRSRTVRLLETLNFYTLKQMFASAGEEIVIDGTPLPEQDEDYEHPAITCRKEAKKHLIRALEADTDEEEKIWRERAADLHALADRYSNIEETEDLTRHRDPWSNVSGRGYAAPTSVAGFGYTLQD